MPARDKYHDCVRNALIKDGWTITKDPYTLKWGTKDLFVDLGAERILAAEKGAEKIAVEIKSFTGPSEMADLEQALGQFTLYGAILDEQEPDRKLFLAVPEHAMHDVFEEPIGQLLLKDGQVRLFAFSVESEEIIRWMP
ncbi:MAG: XisH family protein [Planctomycetaceae bacterium]